jgi:drug/metabolite transporter (DMT)-like permease
MSRRFQAALPLMALSATLFAMMNFLARVATASVSWTTIAAVRSIVAALVAFAVARLRGSSLRGKDRTALFWRSVLGTISMLGTFYALSSRSLSLGDTVTLLNLAPVFLALLAPIFLRERTSGAVAIAIAVALGGVILVVEPAFLFGGRASPNAGSAAGPSTTMTVAAALVAAGSTSCALMMLRRAGKTETPEALSFHFAVFAAITTTTLALFHLRAPTARDLACMVGAGLFGGIAQLTMARAFALERAAKVGGLHYLNPVVSTLLGAGLLHEKPRPLAIGGMVLVIGSGLVITVFRAD